MLSTYEKTENSSEESSPGTQVFTRYEVKSVVLTAAEAPQGRGVGHLAGSLNDASQQPTCMEDGKFVQSCAIRSVPTTDWPVQSNSGMHTRNAALAQGTQ